MLSQCVPSTLSEWEKACNENVSNLFEHSRFSVYGKLVPLFIHTFKRVRVNVCVTCYTAESVITFIVVDVVGTATVLVSDAYSVVLSIFVLLFFVSVLRKYDIHNTHWPFALLSVVWVTLNHLERSCNWYWIIFTLQKLAI